MLPFGSHPLPRIKKLRLELLAMKEEDLETRSKLIESGELGQTEYHPEMKAVHIKNNKRIAEIIEEYGWIGSNLVGEDGAEAAWLIVQHAVLEPAFQKRCVKPYQV